MPLIIKVKLPKKFDIDADKLEAALDLAMNEILNAAQDLFDQSTATFDDKPSWTIRRYTKWHRRILTQDENYVRLNEGTSAHLISPRPGGVLKIPTWSSPKTRLGQLQSMAGGQSNEFVFTKLPVINPGFKGRKFDKLVAKKIKPIFRREIKKAIKAGFRG